VDKEGWRPLYLVRRIPSALVQQFARHAVGLSRGPDARFVSGPSLTEQNPKVQGTVAYFMGSRLLELWVLDQRGASQSAAMSPDLPENRRPTAGPATRRGFPRSR